MRQVNSMCFSVFSGGYICRYCSGKHECSFALNM